MKKFILLAFLLLTSLSFANNLDMQLQSRITENTTFMNISNDVIASTDVEVLPAICVTTVYRFYEYSYVDMEGYTVDVYSNWSSTYCH